MLHRYPLNPEFWMCSVSRGRFTSPLTPLHSVLASTWGGQWSSRVSSKNQKNIQKPCWNWQFRLHLLNQRPPGAIKIIKKALCFTFQMKFTKIYKILKYWPWSTMAIMASIWPFKKAYKTLIILHISLKRPPDASMWDVHVNMRVNQKLTIHHSGKSFFPTGSPFWVIRRSIWTDTQRLRAKIATFFSCYNYWKSLILHSDFPLKWIMKSALFQHGSK